MTKLLEHEKMVTAAGSKASVVIGRDDISKIRGCRPGSELARWIEKNLTSDTLLSNEELRLSEKLSLVPGANTYKDTQGTKFVPLSEDDLLAAIADLDASTEALDRQTQALESQKTHVEHRIAKSKRKGGQISINHIEQKTLADIQRLKADIFEAQNEVEALFRTTRDTTDRVSKKFPSMVSEVLNSNDRTLDDLTKADLAGASAEQATSTSLDRVERLTTMLSRTVVAELQTRLDRVYLENLQVISSPLNGEDPGITEDMFHLEQDLKSLYMDIPDVAKIFVTQKYKDPLVRAVKEEERQRKAMAGLHSLRIATQLSIMAVDLEQLTERLRAFHSYRCVMQNLQTGYEHFLTTTKIDISSPEKSQAKCVEELYPAMDRMLRHFGLPATSSSNLHESITNKVVRLRDSGRKLGSGIDNEVKKTLAERKKIVESLLHGIDQDDEKGLSRLNALDSRLTRLREEVEDVSGADAGESLRKQRVFVEKWS